MERRTLDRSFAEKYLPIVYKTALEQFKDPALAKLAAKRVFLKVQDAMNNDSMPAETVLKAWLVFLTEDEVAAMKKQMFPASDPPSDTAHSAADTNAAPASIHIASQPVQSAEKAGANFSGTASAPSKTELAANYSKSSTAPGDAVPSAKTDTTSRHAKVRSTDCETGARVHHRVRPANAFLIVLFVILIVINLWFIVGLLSSREILPKLDWGYSWFDTFVFKLFDL